MADKSENTPSLGFSIQDTMDLGMGNPQLIEELFGSESSTEDPSNIEKIENPPAPQDKEVIKYLIVRKKMIRKMMKLRNRILYQTF